MAKVEMKFDNVKDFLLGKDARSLKRGGSSAFMMDYRSRGRSNSKGGRSK